MCCKRCGKKLDAEDRFCSFCGFPVEIKKTVSDCDKKEEMEPVYQQWNSLSKDRFDEEWEREERREKFTFMMFGVLIVVLIVAIASGVAVLVKRENNHAFLQDLQLSEELKDELEQSQKRDEVLAELEKDNANNIGSNTPDTDSNLEVLNKPEAVITPELLVPNEVLNENESIQHNDQIENERVEESEYVICDSDVRYLVSADLKDLTVWEIRVARNEIFARHGRMFDTPELKEYFESKSWYEPTIPAVEFKNSCLNPVELENLNFIINYEKAHNLN